jgi:hypothetical protein
MDYSKKNQGAWQRNSIPVSGTQLGAPVCLRDRCTQATPFERTFDFRFVADRSDMPHHRPASQALLRRSKAEDEVKKGCGTRFPKPLHALA